MATTDSFRAARWTRLINLLLQAVLFLTLFAGLNYIALNHSWRFDLTQNRRHSLSAETEAYLKGLQQPVTITVTISNDERADDDTTQAYREISALLREYVYKTRLNPHGKIELNFLDVYKNGRRAAELNINRANAVVVESGNNRKILTIEDFYRIKNLRRDSFQGEATMTAAILDVSHPDKKKIYFVSGHGEMSPEDTSVQRGLSLLRDELRARNFDVSLLDLSLTRSIPEDQNSVLIIAGPQRRFQLYEEELLRNYLSTRAGRVIILTEPRTSPGLDNLFFEWGVTVYNKIIYDLHQNSAMAETNDLRFWNFAPDPSRITEVMLNNNLALQVGGSRVVVEDKGRASDDGLRVATLVASSEAAWGETDFFSRPVFTPGQDLQGQLGAVAISERLKPADNLPLSVRGGRLAVFGTADLIANQRIELGGNFNLFLATVRWAADSETEINVPVRPIERFSLSLSQEELLRLRLALFLIVPGIVAIIGLIVYWTRRD